MGLEIDKAACRVKRVVSQVYNHTTEGRRFAANSFFRQFTVPKNRPASREHGNAQQSPSGLPRLCPTLPSTNPFASHNVTLPTDEDQNAVFADFTASVPPSPSGIDAGFEHYVADVAANREVVEISSATLRGSEDQFGENSIGEDDDDDNNNNNGGADDGVYDTNDSGGCFEDFVCFRAFELRRGQR